MDTLETKTTALVFERQRRESSKAFAAFKTYLDLGPNRSLVAAAAKLDCSKRRMESLSRKYDWPGRVVAFNRHFAELERQALRILEAFADRPHVFNLGHGIGQTTPLEHVGALLSVVCGWRG